MKKSISLYLLTCLLLLLVTPTVFAVPPVPFSDSWVGPAQPYDCGNFLGTFQTTFAVEGMSFYDQDGSIVRDHAHWVIQMRIVNLETTRVAYLDTNFTSSYDYVSHISNVVGISYRMYFQDNPDTVYLDVGRIEDYFGNPSYHGRWDMFEAPNNDFHQAICPILGEEG